MSDETQTKNSGDGSFGPEGTRKVPPMPAPSFASQDFSGHTLGGYQLVRKIAEGGMGVVYEAIQTRLDRKVALKVLTEQLGGRSEFLQRFEREAKAAAALSHPSMVQVFDYGEAEGRHYIIMEYIEGENLAAYVERQGKLSVEDALGVIEQAAQALKAASDKSIIHRDIKPSNLLLTMDGRVKVADLGLAKILSEESELTLSSVGIGSPHFIAPEQADDSRRADHRADIYSLGVTLLYLLTGKHAYDGASPISIVLAHANKPLPSGAELGTALPNEVEELIHRMAAKDPNDRYQDYQSLILDLQRVKTGLSPAATVGKSSARKSQMVLLLAAVAGIAAIAAIVVFTSKSKPATPANTSPPVTAVSAEVSSEAQSAKSRPDPHRPEFVNGQRHPPEGEFQQGEGRGRGGGPGPLGPPAGREFYDVPVGAPREMLAFADDYAKQHPQNFEEILDGYRQVEERAAGGPIGAVVAERMRTWSAQKNETLTKEITTRETKMKELIKAGKLQEAYSVWRDFPSNLRSWEIDEQIRKIVKDNFPSDFHPEGSPPH